VGYSPGGPPSVRQAHQRTSLSCASEFSVGGSLRRRVDPGASVVMAETGGRNIAADGWRAEALIRTVHPLPASPLSATARSGFTIQHELEMIRMRQLKESCYSEQQRTRKPCRPAVIGRSECIWTTSLRWQESMHISNEVRKGSPEN
jgi:hypothetical protein